MPSRSVSGMEILALLFAVVLFAILAVAFGSDSRTLDDPRSWWQGPDDSAFPTHHA